jgi:formylglycine-generating enzyme required for sulfatase activity
LFLLEDISGDALPPDVGHELPTPAFASAPQPVKLIPLSRARLHAAKAESSHNVLLSLPGAIGLSASSHHFGEVAVGDHAEWTLTLANEAKSEKIISFKIINLVNGLRSDGFSLVEPPSLPLIIPPQGTQDLTVRYAPDLAGKKSAVYLSIATDGHEIPSCNVILTGTAIIVFRESERGFPSSISNSVGMIFRYIPAGTFLLGSPDHERGRHDDEVPHEVTITTGFYMQTTQVTQGQWRAVMGNNPSSFQNLGGDCPVEQVSWYECQKFIKRLNSMGEGTYRLPAEAEWEYASRAGSKTAYALGEITALFCDYDPILNSMGWYCGNSDGHTHPVAQKAPNAWGLYDMHGNVFEWCQDWYGQYPRARLTGRKGPASGRKRVIRGGAWFNPAKTCRSASRLSMSSNSKSPFVGLRLVRVA